MRSVRASIARLIGGSASFHMTIKRRKNASEPQITSNHSGMIGLEVDSPSVAASRLDDSEFTAAS